MKQATSKAPAAGARVYSYSRISSAKQLEGTGMERQADYAAAWAAQHGLTLDTQFNMRDEGLSAYHQKHVKSGALGVFLKAVQEGRIPEGSVLVVESLDRLSRATAMEAQAQLAMIINAGIRVVTVKDEKEYSRESLAAEPMQLIWSVLVMIRAHEESDTKSKRVKAAFKKKVEGWVAGTYRGPLRVGKDPAWLTRDESGAWQFVPERVEAIRIALDLYRKGWGVNRIDAHLVAKGHAMPAHSLFRLVASRALIGIKEVECDGTEYVLEGFYPPVLTRDEWDEIQSLSGRRQRSKDRSECPGILNGSGVLHCAYCGNSMAVHVMNSKGRQADGRLRPSSRRVRCFVNGSPAAKKRFGLSCPHSGDAMVHPFERALMSYCSNMMNIRSLYEGDRAAAPKAALREARAALADIETKSARLLEVIMSSDKAPALLSQQAAKLEELKEKHVAAIANAERELAAVARTHVEGMDVQWRELAAGVEAHDYDARMKVRGMVAETFERISLEWKKDAEGNYGMVLCAKGGAVQVLRVDAEGNWKQSEDIDALPDLRAA